MPRLKTLSVRALEHLTGLQMQVRRLSVERNRALRMLLTSRGVATAVAQREFWLEFAWVDQEYRFAVRQLASFCAERAPSERSHERHRAI